LVKLGSWKLEDSDLIWLAMVGSDILLPPLPPPLLLLLLMLPTPPE
jgi:hypothetical protein